MEWALATSAGRWGWGGGGGGRDERRRGAEEIVHQVLHDLLVLALFLRHRRDACPTKRPRPLPFLTCEVRNRNWGRKLGRLSEYMNMYEFEQEGDLFLLDMNMFHHQPMSHVNDCLIVYTTIQYLGL